MAVDQRDDEVAKGAFPWPVWFVHAFAECQEYSVRQGRRLTKNEATAWSFSKAECDQFLAGNWPTGDIAVAWRKGAIALSALTDRSDFIMGSQDPDRSDALLRGRIGEAKDPNARGLEWQRAGVAWRGASESQRFWLSLFAGRNWALSLNGEGWLCKWGRLLRFASAAEFVAFERRIADKYGSRDKALELCRRKVRALPTPLF